MSAFDREAFGGVEIAIRLAVAVLITFRPVGFYAPALAVGGVIIGIHVFRSQAVAQAEQSSSEANAWN